MSEPTGDRPKAQYRLTQIGDLDALVLREVTRADHYASIATDPKSSTGHCPVRAAARAVGVHQDAGYNWLRNPGLTMPRATPRTYSPEDKAEFFRRLADNPNLSAIARELGFTRVTCYSWAYKAGIRTPEARKLVPEGRRS